MMAMLFMVILPAPAAIAGVGPGQPCAYGANSESIACMNGQNGERYFGGYDNFTDLTMTVTAPQNQTNHINNEMWLWTHIDESQWVEMGIRSGAWPGNNAGYGRFWADYDVYGTEFRHLIAFVPNGNGSNHSYEIMRDTVNHNFWDIYLDYNYIGQSTNQNSSVAYEVAMGLEDSLVTPATYAALFNHSPLMAMNTSGTWYKFPYAVIWEDYPCASYPKGYCLSYALPAVDIFKVQKP